MLITIALFMYSSHSHSIKCSFYSIYFFIPFESQRFEKPCNFFMGQQTIRDNYVIQTLKVLEQQTCSASLCARWRRLQLYNAHLMNACANKLAYVWAILLHCPCLVFFFSYLNTSGFTFKCILEKERKDCEGNCCRKA